MLTVTDHRNLNIKYAPEQYNVSRQPETGTTTVHPDRSMAIFTCRQIGIIVYSPLVFANYLILYEGAHVLCSPRLGFFLLSFVITTILNFSKLLFMMLRHSAKTDHCNSDIIIVTVFH